MAADDIHAPRDTDLGVSASDSYARLRELFAAVADLDEAQRAIWIAANVADAEERAALERLLSVDGREGGYFDITPGEHAARMQVDEPLRPDGLIGQRIGAFRLTRLIGKGGMAAVFLGEREGADFAQRAAIKLLRRGLYSEIEQRLFRRERQLLAALDHPHIARLIDGGVTAGGIPYLIIEYVDGVPITEHAAAQRLDVRARLELFVVVCRAVAAAHRALIVHRDIKPSNILVTAQGSVKLLDFGIAKLLEEEGDQLTAGVFTPEYAAPEQLASAAVTTATDVYALGILLHELLLGTRPAKHPLRRPSLQAVAGQRRGADNANALRGDLDTILLKCLAEEAAQRYASAGALADDVERYLAGRPVEAHPPSRRYRARKFVQRHRTGVALGAIVAGGILGALVLATMQWRSAHHEAARANRAKDFIEDMFAPIDASVIEGKQMSVHDLLANATQKLDRNRELDAAERIDLQMLFSRLHEKMGEPEAALALANQAAEQSAAAFGANDPQALAARAAYAYALLEHEDAARATPMLLALEASVRAGAPLHGMPLVQLDDGLAELADRRGEHALALQHEQRALAERIAHFGADSAKAATGYNNVAISLDMSGRHADAIEAFRHSYAIHLAREGADSFETANARSNLATAEMMAGRLRAAHADFLAAEPVFEAAPNNRRNRNVQYWQSRCLLAVGIGGADELSTCQRAAQLAKDILSATAVRLRARALRVDAQMRVDRGDFAAARADLQQADALLADSGDALSLGVDGYLRAELDAVQGDADAAALGLARALERIGRNFPEYLRLNALAARALVCARRAAVVEPACPRDAVAQARGELDADANPWNPWLLRAHIALARIDLEAGRSEAAADRLRRASANAAPEVDPAQLNLLLAQAWLAAAERRTGKCAASDALRREVRETARAQGLEAHPMLLEALRATDAENACAAIVN